MLKSKPKATNVAAGKHVHPHLSRSLNS